MSVTSKRPRQNQVLVATRSPHALGPTAMPRIEDSADVNFIHLELAEPRIGVVGLRAPAYPKSVDRTRYWIHLAEVLCHLPPSIGIIIGDVNTDPFRRTDIGARTLKSLEGHGWTMPDPLGDWSYISKTGTSRSRIDHVLVRDNARLVSATYVDRVGGTVLASAHGGGGISDHAALQVDIEVR
jgi:endonuclease/exonuclease/phosphatase family metal-dependent hydrolase